ncbi:MAG TPA: AMP-binding protein, partial [Dehalococcoidia bacterium]|nr:AMP-binding protein [Dehalococcoidia bacterium]
MQSLIDVLDNSASRHGPLVALKQWSPRGVRSWSYTELAAATRRVAATLQRRGIQHGDRMVLWGPSGPDWVAVFFGCLRAGAILVPLDLRSKDDFLARVVNKTKARYIIAGHDQREIAAGIGPEVLPLEELAGCAEERACSPREARLSEEDVALVVFTSGTTGAPKGVVLSHRNLVANLGAVSQVVPCTPDFRLLSLLPLSHMFELTIGLLAPLRGGASITYVDSLQPASIFQAMKEEGVTCMACVPQVLQLFMAGV